MKAPRRNPVRPNTQGAPPPAEVVLVTPPVPSGEVVPEGSGAPPLGLLYLASALERAGIGVAVVDAAWQRLSPARAASIVLSMRPSLVGITSTTSEYPRAVAMLRRIKDHSPETPCIGGGPHMTHRPAQSLADGFDAVVRGEGEEALVALARRGSSGDLPANVVVKGRPAASLGSADLSAVAWPARDLVELGRYSFPGVMITARGCPHGCYFCSVSRRSARFRVRPEADVLSEAASLGSRHGLTRLEVLDDTVLAIPDRALRLGEGFGKLGFQWAAEARVDEILALGDDLRRLHQSGLSTLFVGIESGDDGVLRRSKAISLDDAERAIDRAVDAGIGTIRASFILGHPWDTPATIDNTERFMLRLINRGVEVSAALLTPYPGSIPGDRPELLGLRIRHWDYSKYTGMWAVIDTPNLEAEWLQDRYLQLLDRLLGLESVGRGGPAADRRRFGPVSDHEIEEAAG